MCSKNKLFKLDPKFYFFYVEEPMKVPDEELDQSQFELNPSAPLLNPKNKRGKCISWKKTCPHGAVRLRRETSDRRHEDFVYSKKSFRGKVFEKF